MMMMMKVTCRLSMVNGGDDDGDDKVMLNDDE